MIQHRGVRVHVFLTSFSALLFLVPAGPVQARTRVTSASADRHLFEASNFPSLREFTMQQAGAPATPQDTMPEGKGKEITQQKCNKCHASSVWDKKHYTQDQWSSVMDQMVEKGMEASDEEIATMTSYLTANYGPVKKDPPVTPPAR